MKRPIHLNSDFGQWYSVHSKTFTLYFRITQFSQNICFGGVFIHRQLVRNLTAKVQALPFMISGSRSRLCVNGISDGATISSLWAPAIMYHDTRLKESNIHAFSPFNLYC